MRNEFGFKPLPDLEHLQDILDYSPDTGLFFWKPRPLGMFKEERTWKAWMSLHCGKRAFRTVKKGGYLYTLYRGRSLLAHRVAYYMGHGVHPDRGIDHINGVCDDNRLINLRLVSYAENQRNRRLTKLFQSGFMGVKREGDAWHCKMKVSGKDFFLGSFPTLEEAAACRQGAERMVGFHENHGKTPEQRKAFKHPGGM